MTFIVRDSSHFEKKWTGIPDQVWTVLGTCPRWDDLYFLFVDGAQEM
jgi:hypothetical protein